MLESSRMQENRSRAIKVTFIFLLNLWWQSPLQAQSDSNKDIVVAYMQAINDGGDIGQFVAPGFHHIRAEFENLIYNARGSELMSSSDPLYVAIPDRTQEIENVIAEDETVAVQYRISGTQEGNLYGIPATGKNFSIYAVTIFELADGKIVSSWAMADEVGLLRQLGVPMPAREDGRYNIPPTGGEQAIPADDLLAQMIANPSNTKEYRNKLKVAARKANNPPPGIIPEEGRPYKEILRYGFQNLTDIGNQTGQADKSFLGAYPDRVDKMDYFLIDGDWVLIRFRLTATNAVSLFGLPPSNASVDAWEVAIMKFDDEVWNTAWWFGDDQAMLMQLGGPQSFWFPEMNITE